VGGLIRASSIIELSYLTISQATRTMLYNKCLLFILKKFFSPISLHSTCYLDPLMHIFSCSTWCLYGSQALISLINYFLHVSISLVINQLFVPALKLLLPTLKRKQRNWCERVVGGRQHVGGPNEVGAAVLLLLYSQRKHMLCLVAAT
jgi:hypothetical protein